MTEEQQIQKGFNHGYQLQKHQPMLAKTIMEGFADKQSPYAVGFRAGSNEWSQEKKKEIESYRPSFDQSRSNKDLDKGKDGKGLEI